MSWRVKTAPASEPISVDDAEGWLKVSADLDTTVITMLIKAARQHVESYLGIGLMEQTIEEKFDRFPPRRWIRLSVGNVKSVTHVKYIDGDGAEQTLSTDVYKVDIISQHARIYLKADQSWETTDAELNNLIVEYVAGESDAADVPGNILLAMHKIIGDNYQNRGDMPVRYSSAVDKLLDQVRQEIFWEYA